LLVKLGLMMLCLMIVGTGPCTSMEPAKARMRLSHGLVEYMMMRKYPTEEPVKTLTGVNSTLTSTVNSTTVDQSRQNHTIDRTVYVKEIMTPGVNLTEKLSDLLKAHETVQPSEPSALNQVDQVSSGPVSPSIPVVPDNDETLASPSPEPLDRPGTTILPHRSRKLWSELSQLDRPSKMALPGFEKVDMSKNGDEELVTFRRKLPPRAIKNTTLVLPTFHYSEIAKVGLGLTNTIRDFCGLYDFQAKHFTNGTVGFVLGKRDSLSNNPLSDMAWSYAKNQVHKQLETAGEQIVEIIKPRETTHGLTHGDLQTSEQTGAVTQKNTMLSGIVTKKNTDPDLLEAPKEIDVFQGRELAHQQHGFVTFLNTVTLGVVQPVAEWFNPTSAYNLAFQHEEFFKEMQMSVNAINKRIWMQLQVNGQNIEAIESLRTATELANQKITDTIDILPKIIHLSNIIQIGMQRYADLLEIIYQDIVRNKKLNIPAAQKLEWLNSTEEYYQSTEGTEIVPFKQWTDHYSYMQYTGPEYMMHNRTCNCSTFIDKPTELRVKAHCVHANTSIELDDGAQWTK
ncbi:Hypothetical predicted protein, partial [Olea europaea subsp. europaea]